jgi:hypothetical protein
MQINKTRFFASLSIYRMAGISNRDTPAFLTILWLMLPTHSTRTIAAGDKSVAKTIVLNLIGLPYWV